MVNVDNWGVVFVDLVVWLISVVGIYSLVIMVDSFMIDWLDLVASKAFEIVRDCLMWCSHIIIREVVMVFINFVSMMIVIMMEVSICISNLMVLVIMVVGAVLNCMINLMIEVFVLYIMMLSLNTLNMWLDLMDACLFKRSVV